MKFGQQLAGYDHGDAAIDYNELKQLIRSEQDSEFNQLLMSELQRVDDYFAEKEDGVWQRCTELEEQWRATGKIDAEHLEKLEEDCRELIKFVQWNATAVRKIIKKFHRWRGVGRLPRSELWFLERTHFYQSLTPARVLAILAGRKQRHRRTASGSVVKASQKIKSASSDSSINSSSSNRSEQDSPGSASASTQCAVCMDNMQAPVMCSCGHAFCYDCVKLTDACPICRKPHSRRFVHVGTGEVVEGLEEFEQGWRRWLVACQDWAWYMIIFSFVLPFGATVFLVGFLITLGRAVLDMMLGNELNWPSPFRYHRMPRILRPHYANTEHPPWSFPSLFE